MSTATKAHQGTVVLYAIILFVVMTVCPGTHAQTQETLIGETFERLQNPSHVPGPEYPWLYSAEGTYLIVAADEFLPAQGMYSELEEFAAWKQLKGFYVILTRLSSIPHTGCHVTADDVLEHVRTVYNKEGVYAGIPSLRYLLIVGECGGNESSDVGTFVDLRTSPVVQVPSFYVETEPLDEDGHYYADQPYVENLARGGSKQFYQYDGVVVGRISVSTYTECATVLGKTLKYDRDPDTGTWYGNLLSAGYYEDVPPNEDGLDDGMGALDIVTTVHLNLKRFSGYNSGLADGELLDLAMPYSPSKYPYPTYKFRRLTKASRLRIQARTWDGYGGEGQPGGMPEYIPLWATDQMWIGSTQAGTIFTWCLNGYRVDNGVGLVFYTGHGNQTGWTNRFVCGPTHVAALNNGVQTPVILSFACSTGTFAYTSPSHCENLLRKEGGGCVGIVGATAGSLGSYSRPLAYGTLIFLFGQAFDTAPFSYPGSGVDMMDYPVSQRPAEALACGKAWMRKCGQQDEMGSSDHDDIRKRFWYMYEWFGDPELSLRTMSPVPLFVFHGASLPANGGMFGVYVNALNAHLEGARVAIVPLDETLAPSMGAKPWVKLTSSNGWAVFTLPVPAAGPYAITVTAPDAIPYRSVIGRNYQVLKVPSQYSSIQSAVNAAPSSNALVLVSPGTYSENIFPSGKSIGIRSLDPTSRSTLASTIIQGDGTNYTVRLAGGEGPGCVIAGLSITGGYYGGVKSDTGLAAPVIAHNRIYNNSGNSSVYGIRDLNASVIDNEIYGNVGTESGGGINGCNGSIRRNTIHDNTAYYGYGIRDSHGLIEGNLIYSNGGTSGRGMFYCNGSIVRNIVVDNTGTSYGYGLKECNGVIQANCVSRNNGDVAGRGLWACTGTIKYNTIYGNSQFGLQACAGSSSLIVGNIVWANGSVQVSTDCSLPTYSCIQGWTRGGTGNITTNPLLTAPENDDYHLMVGSPCIDAALTDLHCDIDGDVGPVDGNGDGVSKCDIGADEFPQN